jgi:RNA polymerase sigma-54 factor
MQAPALHLDRRQHQTLSPRLQQAVRLLQLSSTDFAQEVHDTLSRNPFLEGEDVEGESANAVDQLPASLQPIAATAGDGHDGEGATALPPIDLVTATEGASDLASHLANAVETVPADGVLAPTDGDIAAEAWAEEMRYGDQQMSEPGSGGRGRDDGEFGVMDTMATQTSLAAHLHGQLNVLPLTERDLVLSHALVESLDDDGYLRMDLQELGEIAGLEPAATDEELQIALKRVQSLDPAGVAARSVQECLLLQLPAIDDERERELARRVVSDHLDALAAKDVNGLARKLGCSVADVEAVCARIRRLDPRPGWRYFSAHVQYVTPDVIVKKVQGQWRALLNPAIVPKVRLNQVYAELFQRHRSAQHGELAAHLQEARWTLRNVEQRFATIVSVAQAIVQRQRHFLDYGPLAMKPLGLREIADEVGLHESTVSRVTNNKYMATPMGVFELKYFFSRAMSTASGGACSATAIRGLIKDMIDAETPTDPLSDAEIARQLATQGLVVARRTVTKYRQLMKIEAVERRRHHAV